jgi:transcriptional regulator with XRE-family HTH domain
MIGPRLREARLARHLSLNTVAVEAEISVATLSRIERDQQRLDVELLLSLMRILKLAAHDVLDDAPEGEGLEPIVSKIAALPAPERIKLWRELAARRRATKSAANPRLLAQQVEEFLAQIDFLRVEIESVRTRLR